MLYTSPFFLFIFLPAVVALFWLALRYAWKTASSLVLLLASLVYYAWWDYRFLPLLIGLIVINYVFGLALVQDRNRSTRRLILTVSIVFNLVCLGFFKYFNFAVENINWALGAHWAAPAVILPIGLSFITFQKIAFLVDAYHRKIPKLRFIEFSVFASFFPQLIAGPIVHYKEIGPQLIDWRERYLHSDRVAVGLTLLSFGLFKKLVLADQFGDLARPLFAAAGQGVMLTFVEAWLAALFYGLQIYFDFSAYSDMSIGMARLFGVKLPLNFYSPYKSTSIIDFWRRWHITLSRFLREYLYIPLGGNRRGPWRRYFNLLITMVLGGLWHGAAWTFVVWGALHGTYLIVNHMWRLIMARLRWQPPFTLVYFAWLLTFSAVIFAWVPFRATDMTVATSMWKSMLAFDGISLPLAMQPLAPFLQPLGFRFEGAHHGIYIIRPMAAVMWLAAGIAIAFCLPNSVQLLARTRPVLSFNGLLRRRDLTTIPGAWSPSIMWATYSAVLFVAAMLLRSGTSDFIYYQF